MTRMLALGTALLAGCAEIEVSRPINCGNAIFENGALLLSFDDRNFKGWVEALPLFEKYGARVTFFVSGSIDDEAVAAMHKLADAGHTVGLHGLNHTDAVPAIKAVGAEKYFADDIVPQLEACKAAGFDIRSFAYPNCVRDEVSDKLFYAHGFEHVRGCADGFTPFDPQGTKQAGRKPVATAKGSPFVPAARIAETRLIEPILVGEAYHPDWEDIFAGIRRAAERKEVFSIISHNIGENVWIIDMKTEWLEKILKLAQELRLQVIGFDELPVADTVADVSFGQAEIAKYDSNMSLQGAVVTNGVKWIDGCHLPIEGRAFDDSEHYYDRLPANVTTNVNAGVRAMKHHTAGMQFRFVTDSTKLTFKWVPFNEGLAMDHMPSTGVSGIDVYRFDEKKVWRYVATGRIWDAQKGGELSIPWQPGTPCLVNLPLYNGIRSFSLGVNPEAKIVALPQRASGIEKPVVFYGTSITHGGCCSRPGMAFPSIVGRHLDVPIINLGFSGSGHGELEMSEYLAKIDASCYVVDCLWNMDEKMIEANYERFIRNLRRLRPDVPIVLTEGCDVYCGTKKDAGIVKRNAYVRPLYERLVDEGWKRLYVLPSEGQYADDLEGTVDGVHPNDWGMMHIAQAFEGVIRQALEETGVTPREGCR